MNEKATLKFLGGAETVTGSKTVIRYGGSTVMVDCGLFQGVKKLRNRNWESLEVNPSEIDHVLLTHAHLDHVGYLPRLVKEGFTGLIHASAPTLDVAKIILRDSAKIQEEDAAYANRKGHTSHDPAEPLYTVQDAKRAFEHYQAHEPRKKGSIVKDLSVTFRPNGHILGSTLIELRFGSRVLVFSGDLGRQESILHPPPDVPSQCDQLVVESTYGDRLHPESDPKHTLANVVNHTLDKGGNLIVPSFALGRAQQLMYLLSSLQDEGRIADCQIYLDSPMGVNITELYLKYSDYHKLSEEQCRDMCQNVEQITDYNRTKEIVTLSGSKIVIAGSGMLTGGRVLFYLKHWLRDHRNTILLTGYQAEGTRGRLLQNGAHELKFQGKYFDVNAEVREISSLSAHADQSEIVRWLQSFPEQPKQVLINHGEPQAAQALRVKLSDRFGWDEQTVELDETYQLTE